MNCKTRITAYRRLGYLVKKINSFKLYFIVSAVSFGLLMLLFIIASFRHIDCSVLVLICLGGVVLNIKFLKDYERGINNE